MLVWIPLALLLAGAVQIEAQSACPCLDICMVLDTSKSITADEWQLFLAFLNTFIDSFDPVEQSINFAAANYSKSGNLVFDLGNPPNNGADYDEVKAALAAIIPERRKTRHDVGLQICLNEVFTDTGGDRPDNECPDITLLITDGVNNTGGDAKAITDALMANGGTVVSVSIGEADVLELLNEISSIGPDGNPLVLFATSFEELQNFVDSMKNLVCPEPQESTPAPTTPAPTPEPTTPEPTTPEPTTPEPTTPEPTTPEPTTPEPTTPEPTTPAPTTAAEQPCACIDFCILIDTSKSINAEEWALFVTFIKGFIDLFDPAEQSINFAAVNYSKSAAVVFNLDNPPNNGINYDMVKAGIDSIVPERRKTRHSEGLQLCLNEVFTNTNGDRPDHECPDVTLLLTDGVNNTGGDAKAITDQLKANGGTVISVAIGEADVLPLLNELSSVVNGSPLTLFVDTFDDLQGFLSTLDNLVCPIPPPPPESTTPEPTTPGEILPDPLWQTCCCGVIIGSQDEPYRDTKSRCCGTQIFDQTTEVCCQGAISTVPGKYARCCGSQGYDERYYTCCHGTVVPASRSQDQCCGNAAYNQKNQICCNGVIHKRYLFTRCCGFDNFDMRYGICCGGVVHPGDPYELACCGQAAYKVHSEMCCDPYAGSVFPGPSQLAGAAGQHSCPRSDGQVVYYWKPYAQTCCCGTVTDSPATPKSACCGIHEYDAETQLCCAGEILLKDPSVYRCCGANAFNPSTQTCCNNKVVDKLGLCCGDSAFDPEMEICCDGQVFEGCPSNTKCCYNDNNIVSSYKIKQELCCDAVVQPGGVGFACCGKVSYCTRLYACCNGVLVPRSDFRSTLTCSSQPQR